VRRSLEQPKLHSGKSARTILLLLRMNKVNGAFPWCSYDKLDVLARSALWQRTYFPSLTLKACHCPGLEVSRLMHVDAAGSRVRPDPYSLPHP
jgi:hypothetical protein